MLAQGATFSDWSAALRIAAERSTSESPSGLGSRRSLAQPTSLARTLHTLVDDKQVIQRLTPLAAPPPRGDPRYLVGDPYLRFWLRFVGPNVQEIERGRGALVADRVVRDWPVYRGAAVEPLVRSAIERMLPDERFGDATRVGSWWNRSGGQIDLVGVSRSGFHASAGALAARLRPGDLMRAWRG